MKNLQQVTETYSIQEYKEGTHLMFNQINVLAKSGKLFKVYKYMNNAEQPHWAITDRWTETKPNTIDEVRRSKQTAINFLLRN